MSVVFEYLQQLVYQCNVHLVRNPEAEQDTVAAVSEECQRLGVNFDVKEGES